MSLEKSSSIEISRRTQPFYAKKQAYNLGEQVQIEVDLQREYIDFENSRLIFDAVFGASTDAQTNAWFAAQTIKNLRVKTLAGQMIGHEIREYRAWYQMYMDLTSNNELNKSFYGQMEGAPNTSLFGGDDLIDAGSTLQYAHKFIAHILAIPEYYPAHFHQGLMIEYDLPASVAELCFEETSSGDALPASISIQNVKYVADLVQLKSEMEEEHVKMMQEQRLFADYTEVLTQENTMQATSGLQAYDVVGVDGRVKDIFSYTIQAADRDGDDEQHFGKWGRNQLTSYRYKLGANYLNYESINTSTDKKGEYLHELLKALDINDTESTKSKGGDSVNLTPVRLVENKFATAVKVDKAQKFADEVISSMIDKDRNNVRVELNFGSGAPTVGTIYTHVLLDKRIQILPGSIVRNVRS